MGTFCPCSSKDQGFLGGTIVIEDPNLLFFNYFLNYTKMVNPDIATVIEENESQSQKGVFGSSNCFSYARKSSHFKEAQKIGKGYEQFGIDMRYYTPSPVKPKTQHFLPINKTQFLFGKLSYNISFIKFEHYGLCNQNTGDKNTDLKNHTASFLFPGKKANPRRGENVPSDDTFNDLKKLPKNFLNLEYFDISSNDNIGFDPSLEEWKLFLECSSKNKEFQFDQHENYIVTSDSQNFDFSDSDNEEISKNNLSKCLIKPDILKYSQNSNIDDIQINHTNNDEVDEVNEFIWSYNIKSNISNISDKMVLKKRYVNLKKTYVI